MHDVMLNAPCALSSLALQTTSGKIARARNRRAFVALQSNDALSCPWLRHASGSPASLVLLSWRPPARAATDLSIPDFDSAVSGDALSLFTGLPSSPRDAGPASPATRSTSPRLEGAALHDALRFEVAALLRTDPEAVSPDHALLVSVTPDCDDFSFVTLRVRASLSRRCRISASILSLWRN